MANMELELLIQEDQVIIKKIKCFGLAINIFRNEDNFIKKEIL